MALTFTVVQVDEKKIAGINVKTDMEKSMVDCPALWGKFMPIMCGDLAKNPALIQNAPTYGVSEFIDGNQFTYWAAVQVSKTEGLPEEIQTRAIPAGLYVKCTAPSLEQLGEAYMALDAWMNAQNKYIYDMQSVAFEEYKNGWQMTDSIDIYAAIVEK